MGARGVGTLSHAIASGVHAWSMADKKEIITCMQLQHESKKLVEIEGCPVVVSGDWPFCVGCA